MIPGYCVRRRAARGVGHTLLELMVVMVLLAVTTSLVLPVTVKAYSGFKLRFAADSTARLLQQANRRSHFESRTYLLIFSDPAARDREIVLAREDGAPVRHYTLPSGVSISSRNPDGDWSAEIAPVAFYPDGTSDALQLALHSSSNSVSYIDLDPMTAKAKITITNAVQP